MLERLGYVAGVAFPVALFGGIAMEEAGQPFIDFQHGVAALPELHDLFTTSTANRVGTSLTLVGLVLMVWFAGAMYARFARIGPGARTAAMGWLLAAVAFPVLAAGTVGTSLVTQYDAERVDPAVLVAWLAARELFFGMLVAGFLAISAMLAMAAYLGFAHRALPRWLAWPAAVLAVTMGVGAIAAPITWDVGFLAWVSFQAFLLWSLAAGIRFATLVDKATTTSSTRDITDLTAVPGTA